jgi:hypothetical protein
LAEKIKVIEDSPGVPDSKEQVLAFIGSDTILECTAATCEVIGWSGSGGERRSARTTGQPGTRLAEAKE